MSESESLPEFRADCPCPRKKCERHGKCRECHAHHTAKGKHPPFCRRERKSVRDISLNTKEITMNLTAKSTKNTKTE